MEKLKFIIFKQFWGQPLYYTGNFESRWGKASYRVILERGCSRDIKYAKTFSKRNAKILTKSMNGGIWKFQIGKIVWKD